VLFSCGFFGDILVTLLALIKTGCLSEQPERDDSLVCHSDRGSQCVSIRDTERLAEAGIEPSVGSKGDRCNNEDHQQN
jgi:hypothetical protein